MSEISMSLVEWSRAQFALTAIYHWFFVPLTLGLSFIIAISESIYVKTGNEEWKKLTKFWMKLFGINFAIGVATGIILEFQFGTNWSNYSWLVGDIFGAPLAVEGIMAFFLESTFIAVMFFGWEKMSKKFHLTSTWLVAIGSNLSALWILVANAWMNNPVGMVFNPDTARNEMQNFWEVLLSPTAIHKFLHTISSGYIVASLFVIGISAWFLLKKRHIVFAKRSMIIASVLGFLATVLIAGTGDKSASQVANNQPVKFAAMEGLYKGEEGAGLNIFGIVTPGKKPGDEKEDFVFTMKVPKLLSILGFRDKDAFVPGIDDLVNGNEQYGITGAEERIKKGEIAIEALSEYKKNKESGNDSLSLAYLQKFEKNYEHFGYGFLPDKESIVPNIPLTFYSFHLMVMLSLLFLLVFILVLISVLRDRILNRRLLLKLAIWCIPLGYFASQFGWIVVEVGRQPWTIQDILPTMASVSNLNLGTVISTFWIFAGLFTILLITEIKIMLHQIKLGPKEERS